MPDINFEQMLDDLAEQYPAIKDQALELKDDLSELMPDEPEEELDLELEPELDIEPEIDLDKEDDEEELEIEF